jgi:hypothetical protein
VCRFRKILEKTCLKNMSCYFILIHYTKKSVNHSTRLLDLDTSTNLRPLYPVTVTNAYLEETVHCKSIFRARLQSVHINNQFISGSVKVDVELSKIDAELLYQLFNSSLEKLYQQNYKITSLTILPMKRSS